ncbi:EutN/CcmL family microcompartment protein [candidate division KSB1 bacterium]|nr:EutN/CcmL family microcompartment protein [candidate division KSB1 bacterium]MBL7092906.1 EutN/CcmL family microcompartment protein [candidate division KSB1 bacterium]
MLLAKVIGTVVSTKKEKSMTGLKFLLLKQVDLDGNESGGHVVAADAVGAGIDEMVLYATGSSARQTVMTDNRPCDAVVMAIVDNWEVNGEIRYKKGVND